MSILRDNKGTPIGDIKLAIAMGMLPSFLSLSKFGRNSAIDTAADEDLHDVGGTYVSPVAAVKHIVEAGATDISSVFITGSADLGTTQDYLMDSAATFITNSAQVGDLVANDSRSQYFYVSSLTSETRLELNNPRNSFAFNEGDSYRLITATGSGAAAVLIDRGLLADYTMNSEIIALTGATPLDTIAEYKEIDRARVIHAGVGGVGGGNITFTDSVDSTVTAQITAGNNQTLKAVYTVPASYDLLIEDYYMTQNKAGSASSVKAGLWVSELGGPPTLKHIKGAQSAGTSDIDHQFGAYFKVHSKSTVKIRGMDASANGQDMSGGFDGLLIPHKIPSDL